MTDVQLNDPYAEIGDELECALAIWKVLEEFELWWAVGPWAYTPINLNEVLSRITTINRDLNQKGFSFGRIMRTVIEYPDFFKERKGFLMLLKIAEAAIYIKRNFYNPSLFKKSFHTFADFDTEDSEQMLEKIAKIKKELLPEDQCGIQIDFMHSGVDRLKMLTGLNSSSLSIYSHLLPGVWRYTNYGSSVMLNPFDREHFLATHGEFVPDYSHRFDVSNLCFGDNLPPRGIGWISGYVFDLHDDANENSYQHLVFGDFLVDLSENPAPVSERAEMNALGKKIRELHKTEEGRRQMDNYVVAQPCLDFFSSLEGELRRQNLV